jgi:galactonate dehydratase
MMTVPNFYRLETSRYTLRKYDDFIDSPLDNSGGRLHLTDRAGLGVRMNMEYLRGNILDGFGNASD